MIEIDQAHSSGAREHYGPKTKLYRYMEPKPAPVPAAAGSSSRTHQSTPKTDRRQNSSHSVDAIDDMLDSYVKDGKMCRHAKEECINNEKTRFKPNLRPGTRTCGDAPISCISWKERRQVGKTQKTEERGPVQQHAAPPPTRTATAHESAFRYMAADGSHCSLLKDNPELQKACFTHFGIANSVDAKREPSLYTRTSSAIWNLRGLCLRLQLARHQVYGVPLQISNLQISMIYKICLLCLSLFPFSSGLSTFSTAQDQGS